MKYVYFNMTPKENGNRWAIKRFQTEEEVKTKAADQLKGLTSDNPSALLRTTADALLRCAKREGKHTEVDHS